MKTLCAAFAGLFLSSFAILAFEPGSVVAYSLREAGAEVSAGDKNKELEGLAGVTRFVGFVYDSQNQDIILVGKVLLQKPAITLADLVTGLKARLDHNEWPLVSIDPTKDTERTRQQSVRLEGHLSGTQWGLDFVRADVALKRYCLKTFEGSWPVQSYRDYLEDEIRQDVRASGSEITGISWLSASEGQSTSSNHLGQAVSVRRFSQCRFWFYPTKRQRPVYRQGVFCIKELQLGVQPEESGPSTTGQTNSAGVLFAQAFSASFEKMSTHEPFSRLKGLYDIVSIAEAIRTNKLRSIVSNLITTYHCAVVATPTNYPLEELIGVVRRTDGVPQMVRLAGGMDFSTEIEFLQAGDVTPLLAIVTNTRPNPRTLAWRLPLDSWKMPNMDADVAESVSTSDRPKQNPPGCSIASDSVVFQKAGERLMGNTSPFTGFHPIDPVKPGGVLIELNINEESFQHDTSGDLQRLGQKVKRSRPGTNALFWDVEQ
jgi:hypothetical protein